MDTTHGEVDRSENPSGVRPSRSHNTTWLSAAWGLIALTVLGGIVYLSLAPVWDPDLPGPLDQLPHAAAYGLLTLVLLATLSRRRKGEGLHWLSAVAIGLSLVVLGSVMELLQAIAGRDVQSADAIANAVGIAIALAGWLFLTTARSRRHLGRRSS